MNDIFSIIEAALSKNGYKVLEGDRDSSIVRRTEDSVDFEIKVIKCE